MIISRLSELMGRHRYTQKHLSELTGIRPNTVSLMYYGETKRIDIEHLDKLCEVFDCQPNDIFQYIPNKREQTSDE